MFKKIILEKLQKQPYETCRIPGVVVTNKGTILCYYEVRDSTSDWANINLGFKRSVDNGETFSERILLTNAKNNETYNNPVMIVQKDVIHLMYFKNYEQAFYCQSIDDGQTFSNAIEITHFFDGFKKEINWNVIAGGPGHGITTSKNRLVVPVWIANGQTYGDDNRIKEHIPSYVSVVFSDDNGQTWQTGNLIGINDDCINPNESTVCELSNGDFLLNIRHASQPMYRGISISKDGGKTWSKPFYDENLPDAGCFGGITRINKKEYAFINCTENTPKEPNSYFALRKNLTLSYSNDDCKYWSKKIILAEFSGYGDVYYSQKNNCLVCFFEDDWTDNDNSFVDKLSILTINLNDIIN